MSRLGEAHYSLRGSWSILGGQWSETRRQWRDSVGERFEREVWQEWEEEVPKFLRALNELDEELGRALRQTS